MRTLGTATTQDQRSFASAGGHTSVSGVVDVSSNVTPARSIPRTCTMTFSSLPGTAQTIPDPCACARLKKRRSACHEHHGPTYRTPRAPNARRVSSRTRAYSAHVRTKVLCSFSAQRFVSHSITHATLHTTLRSRQVRSRLHQLAQDRCPPSAPGQKFSRDSRRVMAVAPSALRYSCRSETRGERRSK